MWVLNEQARELIQRELKWLVKKAVTDYTAVTDETLIDQLSLDLADKLIESIRVLNDPEDVLIV